MPPAPAPVATPGRAWWTLFVLVAAMAGCQPAALTEPIRLVAPYAEQQLWGVAPFANESGFSLVDTASISDAFMEQAQQADGIDGIPVNRVIQALRELGGETVSTEADAMAVMTMLDLDALVVGTVTAYDPYRPMKLGLATQLFVRPDHPALDGLDSRELTYATSGHVSAASLGPHGPRAQAAGIFDASNHQTLRWLERYAAGRSEPDSAYGHDLFLVSMDLYTEFVCHRLLRDLLSQEWARVGPVASAEKTR
jgi:hypothetical protein